MTEGRRGRSRSSVWREHDRRVPGAMDLSLREPEFNKLSRFFLPGGVAEDPEHASPKQEPGSRSTPDVARTLWPTDVPLTDVTQLGRTGPARLKELGARAKTDPGTARRQAAPSLPPQRGPSSASRASPRRKGAARPGSRAKYMVP